MNFLFYILTLTKESVGKEVPFKSQPLSRQMIKQNRYLNELGILL